jgi:transcriptional regulator of arginine metabolism
MHSPQEDIMRYSRQNKILELIDAFDIETQEQLAEHLKRSGFDVTQATVSRDINELQLIKQATASGRHKYTVIAGAAPQVSDRFVKIFTDTVQGVQSSDNIIVIKTLPACANAACESIDAIGFPHIIGSIAGDNTIFIVADDQKNVAEIVAHFESLLG